GSKGVTDTVKSANVKAVHYLDVPKNYFDRDNGSVRDAWDRPIVVWLDHDGDGVITIPNGKYATQERTYMSDSVAISLGLQSADRLNDVDKVEFITVGQ
ncbi:MAG: hypothetical protein J6Q65_02730, partial [Lentisphaeria bacterium]|nr:hypothetical protein [Lentisphaeria bacterium]